MVNIPRVPKGALTSFGLGQLDTLSNFTTMGYFATFLIHYYSTMGYFALNLSARHMETWDAMD